VTEENKKPFIAEGRTAEEQLVLEQEAHRGLLRIFIRERDEKIPVRHELALRAILKIVKDTATVEEECIKAICEEALYA
jgi:hypothetical protein